MGARQIFERGWAGDWDQRTRSDQERDLRRHGIAPSDLAGIVTEPYDSARCSPPSAPRGSPRSTRRAHERPRDPPLRGRGHREPGEARFDARTLVVPHLEARRPAQEDDRFLAPAAAGHYMGLTRKRIHDLTSAGALTPDGYDGRTPLYRISTLDAYVELRRQ